MNEMSDASGVELAILKHAAQSNIPVNGSIELLPLCNMNCDMCYVRLDAAQMKKHGRLRTISEWLSLAQEMKEAGTLFLLLTGGEPLLYPEFRTLYTELMSMGMILTVNTNGTLIDEDWADFFAAHKPRRINLTLYGTDNAAYERLCHYKGGYDKASTAIQLLKARCVDVKVGCSAVTSNINDADRIFALADDLGAAVNIDSYMYPTTRERGVAYDTQMRLVPAHSALIWFKSIRHSMSGDQYRSYHNAMLQNVERRKNLADTGSQQISGM